MPALTLRSNSALTALLLPGLLLACSSDSGTAAEEPQATAVVVSPEDFLASARCLDAPGALHAFGVVLTQVAHPEPAPGTLPPEKPPELTVQSAGLVSCEQGIAFGKVVVGGSYNAEICGYDDALVTGETPDDVCNAFGVAPRFRFQCGGDPAEADPALQKPPGAVAEYQALRHIRHCVQTLGPDAGETKLVVSLEPTSAGLTCGEGAEQLERFKVWRDGQPFGEAACGAPLSQDVSGGESFDLELLAYRAGEEEPAYGTTCHARSVTGATVTAACDPLASQGGIELSIAEALLALGASCEDRLLDLFVTLDTGQVLEVPDPCQGSIRFSSVAPGPREVSLSAVRGAEMLTATCAAQVEPGLSTTPDCSAE